MLDISDWRYFPDDPARMFNARLLIDFLHDPETLHESIRQDAMNDAADVIESWANFSKTQKPED